MNKTSRNVSKRLLHNDFTVLALRLAVLYLIWFLCRVVFYLQNRTIIGPLAWSEIPSLFRGSLAFDTVSILYVNSLFIILSLLPFRFRERKGYQKMLILLFGITNTIALIINVIDGVYFHYVRKRLTLDDFFYFGNNDNNIVVILRFMADNWYIVLWGIAAIWLMMWLYRRVKYAPVQIGGRWKYFGVNLLILVFSVGLAVGGIRGGFGRDVRPIAPTYATMYTSSTFKANLILSNMFTMLRSMENNRIKFERYFDGQTLEAIFTPYHHPRSGLRTGPELGRRNVVIFILESFSSEHSALLNPDLYPDGKGFTPFLDSLMREGYYFTNAFTSGRKSIDALPSVLASIPSYHNPFVLFPQSLHQTGSLPRMLGEWGYSTSFFNGSPRGSMGFGAYTSLAGIETYYGKEDFEKKHGTNEYDNFWGIWDEPFLQYMAETLGEKTEPFLATVFTLTSHHPFIVPGKYADTLPEGKTKVHKGVAYTDMALRRFFETARQAPWFENTVFVFVADHVSSETFASKTRTPIGNTHIVSLIYTPDGALRGHCDRVMQQIDLMPTLLGILGNDLPYFAFGRDIFNEPERMAIAVNTSGELYQAITDSVSMLFDGRRVLSVYDRRDTLQQNDISSTPTPYIEQVEREMKARIQQYYEHIERMDFEVQ